MGNFQNAKLLGRREHDKNDGKKIKESGYQRPWR